MSGAAFSATSHPHPARLRQLFAVPSDPAIAGLSQGCAPAPRDTCKGRPRDSHDGLRCASSPPTAAELPGPGFRGAGRGARAAAVWLRARILVSGAGDWGIFISDRGRRRRERLRFEAVVRRLRPAAKIRRGRKESVAAAQKATHRRIQWVVRVDGYPLTRRLIVSTTSYGTSLSSRPRGIGIGQRPTSYRGDIRGDAAASSGEWRRYRA